jgi:hypothetical protein
MSKHSTVEIVNLSGGIIGMLGTNPRKAIAQKIAEMEEQGWHCHQIIPYSTRNTAVICLQFLVLVCTLFLWTFGAGFLLLFIKEE